MRRAQRAVVAFSLFAGVTLSALPAASPPAVRAAEYTLDTSARYDVRPDDGWIDVSVDVAFTNTTPDPPGQFSVFNQVKLAVHDAAALVAASDDQGEMTVRVAPEGAVNVATVSLRTQVRFEGTAHFTLAYRLPHDESEELRVSPSLIVFPTWGFGTSSNVTVVLPAGYEVRVDGDPLEASPEASRVVLRSGAIADPTQWLALLVASRPASYTTLSAAVPLTGGTADVQVRAFAEDEAWGRRTLDLLERGLPLLEERIGLPYPAVGPLVVTESVGAGGAGFGEVLEPGTEIAVAFDQPEFTVLHQAAHIWIGPSLASARWIREGLASWVAAGAAAELSVDLPYAPAEEAGSLAAAAFPLDAWPADPSPEQQRWGYAAGWSLVDELASAVGEAAIQRAIERAAAGVGPYAPDGPADGTGTPRPIDSRAFLDGLDALGGGTALADRFGAVVLNEEDAALLGARAAARTAYEGLVAAAGDWGTPDPVRAALEAWSFDTATEEIDAAVDWLAQRDELLAAMSEAGLAAPQRLELIWRADGGGPDAHRELERELSVVRAYAIAIEAANAPRVLLARIGLLGSPDPAVELATAHGRFADGDLLGAANAIAAAQRGLQGAVAAGITRLLSVAALLLLVAGVVVVLLRRRRVAAREA